jgi:hypothetical protein
MGTALSAGVLLAVGAPAFADGYVGVGGGPSSGGVSGPSAPVAAAPIGGAGAPSSSTLPFTGLDLTEIVGIGVASIGTGVALRLRSRRTAS